MIDFIVSTWVRLNLGIGYGIELVGAWWAGLNGAELAMLGVLAYFVLITPLAMGIGRLLRRARKTQTRPVDRRESNLDA